MPIRPIRGILTRARARTSERASDRACEVGPRKINGAEVGADSRIDVDTLAYQSHSPNGHRRVKSLHLLPLSGRAPYRARERTRARCPRPFAPQKTPARRRQETHREAVGSTLTFSGASVVFPRRVEFSCEKKFRKPAAGAPIPSRSGKDKG